MTTNQLVGGSSPSSGSMKTCNREDCESTDLASRSAICKDHHREYNREHYKKNKQYYIDKAKERNDRVSSENRQKLIEYLNNHPCVDCGNSDIEVLQFDHTDEKEKKYDVSIMLSYSWTTIKIEIDKCQVRCANCHMKRTRRQFGFWIVE